jgi:hypothetical protein
MRIELQFTCKWTLDFDNDFVFVERFNFLVNLKTGKILKQITKGGSIGYVIKGKFYTLKKLKGHLIKIEKKDCPF